MDYIIVQAGGKGTRLRTLTENKPKALVPVENLPMLFHLFRKYPDKRFVIIADYKKEVLKEYLHCFAEVKYQVVEAYGTGTCSGIAQALDKIPEKEPFMLIWSDLILARDFELPEEYTERKIKNNRAGDELTQREDYVGISTTFSCRWSYSDGNFFEKESSEHGVAGFFLFTDKEKLKEVPDNGELVRWMQKQRLLFKELAIAGTREFGLIEEYEKLVQEKCRPFNRVTVMEERVIKEGSDEQGRKLASLECAWYEKASELHIPIIPQIYRTDPLEMERINGRNIYEYDLTYFAKKEILKKLVAALKGLHDTVHVPTDSFSCKEAYFNKTFSRIHLVRDLVPFADQRKIKINGKICRNVFFYKRELEKRLEQLSCPFFAFIHGDCTFSNMMLRDDGTPVLIDPRGYFGYTKLYGDPLYDWAKLYYSIAGNYDQFNLKRFQLTVDREDIELKIESNHWEEMEEDFFELTGTRKEDITLLHAVIWLSLTTYAWHDYDSICGAFYNGLYYLEDVL